MPGVKYICTAPREQETESWPILVCTPSQGKRRSHSSRGVGNQEVQDEGTQQNKILYMWLLPGYMT